MANKILLPNGCAMSTPTVNPSDWKSGGRSLLYKDWYIQYYFYDPFGKRKKKLCIVKGMNEYKTLKERRSVTEIIIEDEIHTNQRGYNPILKKFIIPEDPAEADLHPDLPFIDSFRIALTKVDSTSNHKKEIKIAVNRLEKAAIKLKLANNTIGELQRVDMKRMMEACKLPDSYFNKFRSYISRLFLELLEYECCETNLMRDIRKKKTVNKKREILSPDEFKIVMQYLHDNYYEFWRYAQIFLYSGARTSELFLLQAEKVSLKLQEFVVTIKKGQHYKEHTKVILQQILPLWQEILNDAKPKDYIFSKGLVPGAEPISPKQITRRWYRLVKNSEKIKDDEGNVMNITSDFYALKHSFLDSLPTELAQSMASHTSAKTTSIYQVNKEKREREKLKSLDLNFMKVV